MFHSFVYIIDGFQQNQEEKLNSANDLTNNNKFSCNEWIIAMWFVHNALINTLSVLLCVVNDLKNKIATFQYIVKIILLIECKN